MSDNMNAETVVVTNATLFCIVLVSKLDSRAALQTYVSGQKSKLDEISRKIALPIYIIDVSFSSVMFSQKSKRFIKRFAPRFRRLSAMVLSDTWLLSFWFSLLLLSLLLLLLLFMLVIMLAKDVAATTVNVRNPVTENMLLGGATSHAGFGVTTKTIFEYIEIALTL